MTKDFELVKSIVDGTDWNLLKKQKTALINMTHGHGQEIHNLSSDQIDRFQGIVNWIEAIQDKIVDLGYKTEAEVFCTEAGSMKPIKRCPECKKDEHCACPRDVDGKCLECGAELCAYHLVEHFQKVHCISIDWQGFRKWHLS